MTLDRRQYGIMKAKPLTEKLLSSLGTAALAQPKLRGQRCRTQWAAGFPILTSSYKIPFDFLSHIQQALIEPGNPLPFDGELYRHDETFTQEHINSICNRHKNPHPDAPKIEYHIFDLATPDPQWKRTMILEQFFRTQVPSSSPIKLVHSRTINTLYWKDHCSEFLSQNYEGIILRSLQNSYSPLDPFELAKRPSSILKFKPRNSDFYKILGFREGTGWAKGMLGALHVRGRDSSPFYVGTGKLFTKENRARLWRIRATLPGQYVEIYHEPTTTKTGLPVCTSARAIVQKNPEGDF